MNLLFTGCQAKGQESACRDSFLPRAHATLPRFRGVSLLQSMSFFALTVLLPGCVHRPDTARYRSAPAPGYFRDVTQEVGLQFRYDNDATLQRRFIETTGGGCAFLDYDNDGYVDIFAVQGGPAPGSSSRVRPPHALYRNIAGQRFADVTVRAGLAMDTGYGQGVAAADYDNDGWCDLLITAYGGAHLFRNQRGRFVNVTRAAGLTRPGLPHWVTSAAWADYDRDGYLDLFLCHYAYWFPDSERPCFAPDGTLMYCPPTHYAGDTSRLLRNRGNGTFEDVSTQVGLHRLKGKALGCAWLDYDRDGWPDLCVANDMMPNYLLRNLRNGRFREVGREAGVALGNLGLPLSGMGVTAGDFDGDLWEDIVIVNFSLQPRTYLRNTQQGFFEWVGPAEGLGLDNQPFLAFGVEALDYNNDGHLDLVIGNGHINDAVDRIPGNVTYRQRQQLMRNTGNGRFEDMQRDAGDLNVPRVTRGLAVGDYDNDGRPDCLMSGPAEPLTLFRNVGPSGQWIGFRLEGTRSNRDGVGTEVRVTAGGRMQVRYARSGSSYLARGDPRILFGLGTYRNVGRVEVFWPGGTRQIFRNLEAGRYYRIRENGSCEPDPRSATHPSRHARLRNASARS